MIVPSVLCAIAVMQVASPSIYFVRNDAVYKFSQGRESLVVKHASGPAVSPDEKRIAFLREGNLYLYDFEKGESRRCSLLSPVSSGLPDRHQFPSWDASSRYVIFGHADRYTVTRHGETVQSMFASEHSSKALWNVYWCWTHKTGSHADLSLFLGNETSGLSSFSVVSSLSAAFSPDGRRVAFCRNGDLWMATLDRSSVFDGIREASWDEARILACGTQEGGTRASNETNSIFRISWSPDGKLLALSSDRNAGSGSAMIQVVKSDRPTEKVGSFAGRDACFLDNNRLLYVKPYAQSEDIWMRDIETMDEKLLIPHATEPAVKG